MNVMSALRDKFSKQIAEETANKVVRRQLNATIHTNLIHTIRLLGHQLEVPRFTITEHALQTGLFCLANASQDPQKRDKLQQHLVQGHLLGDPATEQEAFFLACVPDLGPAIIQLTSEISDLDTELDYFLLGPAVKTHSAKELTANIRKTCEQLRFAIADLCNIVGTPQERQVKESSGINDAQPEPSGVSIPDEPEEKGPKRGSL